MTWRFARRANHFSIVEAPCPSPRAKIFDCRRRANHCFNSARLTADEGRVAIVTNVAVGCGGRVSCARRTQLSRTVKSCGPDAPTLASSFAGRLAGDGGKKARSPRRARRKPLKPLCRESRIDPVSLWFLTRVLTTFAHEAAGASDTRLSLRPLSLEGQGSCTARALSASREAKSCLTAVIARSDSDEAIHSFFAWRDGLLC
jgi:hypothetical protein